MSISGSGTTVNLGPIPYTENTPSGTVQQKFPVLYSNGTGDKCMNGSDQILCAISITQPSAGNPIQGTVYVPHGVVWLSANSTAATGQVVADTIHLQSGNSAINPGVAYKGSVAAPVPGTAVLVE